MRKQNKTWIESIPSKWSVGRISYKYQVQLGKMLQPDPKNPEDIKRPYLRSANINWNGVKLDDVKEMWFSPNDIKKYKLNPLDVLVSEGGDVGRASFWDDTSEMYIQNAVNRLRPITEESNPKFVFYWFSFLKNHGLIDIMCDGSTIAHYTAEKVKATQLVFPTIEEQTLIARFLDYKTSQIDKLIEQKEKLLKLLTEKRTAIITQAVTKGLDPNVDLKDSGIDWLGKIPKHWETKRLRFLIKTNPVKSEVSLEDDELVSFVPMEAVQEYGGISLEQEKEISEVYNGYTYFKNGDVVVAKITPCFENGKGSIAAGLKNDIAFGTTELHVLRPKKQMDHEFLFYLTISDSFRKIGESWMYGAGGQKRVPELFIKNLIVPICNIEEQRNIVISLRKKVNEIQSVLLQIENSIRTLKEFREALITSAVTGQIKV